MGDAHDYDFADQREPLMTAKLRKTNALVAGWPWCDLHDAPRWNGPHSCFRSHHGEDAPQTIKEDPNVIADLAGDPPTLALGYGQEADRLLGEVCDWLGAPDWNGPQLPVDLARRIAQHFGGTHRGEHGAAE